MTIIGIDDTDSRTLGMCTTYLGHKIAERLEEEHNAAIYSLRLIRLNPAAQHKTRGNASVAIFTDAKAETSYNVANDLITQHAAFEDEETNPGLVVFDGFDSPKVIQKFTKKAIQELVSKELALSCLLENKRDCMWREFGNGRGLIGATAAIGAGDFLSDWTYEKICYRDESRWGEEREVNYETIFDGADRTYPLTWDTVDREQNESVCVPHTPCPILYGLRGDNLESISELEKIIESEPVVESRLFETNQGTDVHLQDVEFIAELQNNSAYRVSGEVSEKPETIEGGHTIFTLSDSTGEIECAAFEPTKHFRKLVRDFRVGDDIVVCGEVKDETLKIEKFKTQSLNTTKYVNPTCPNCGNSMSSAGRNQGYRCRDCNNHTDEKCEVPVDRELDVNTWYEVPPCARRHIAKPLIRGGFDGETNPFV